jgi:hypothetical protein
MIEHMFDTVLDDTPKMLRKQRLAVLFCELSELAGQRNAIDARVVGIVAELDRDHLWGMTGARSVAALVAWKLGMSSTNAHTIATVAHRVAEFPRCVAEMGQGRLSLDQVGVIAARAGRGSDEHYASLAAVATVNQLRTALKLEPRPAPEPDPWAPTRPDGDRRPDPDPAPPPLPPRSISTSSDAESTTWKITLPHAEAATFDAALASHTDALVARWKREHANRAGAGDGGGGQSPPVPSSIDGFLSLIEAGWDTDVARRPHGQRTTVVVHVDLQARIGSLHLGPLLSDAERRYLSCDATCEVWFERHGQVVGAGRETRTISRRLRRALEHRDRCCVVPGCGATRGLHAHHLRHWEDGGPTELFNVVLVCPYHHRMHHRGLITLTGPAERLVVTDAQGAALSSRSLARPPTGPPPAVGPYPGPTGERADWWCYDPFEEPPPLRN